MTVTHGISSMKIGWIEKGTGEHQSNQIYSAQMARTLDANEYKHPMLIEDGNG